MSFTLNNDQRGVTLIEVLIILAFITILSLFTVIYLPGYRVNQDLDFDSTNIVNNLRDAQQRSIVEEDINNPGEAWGVHFDNTLSSGGYYQLFKGTAYSAGAVVKTLALRPDVEFEIPGSGSAFDVIFKNTSGLPTAAQTVKVHLKNNIANFRLITVNIYGAISY